MEYSSDEDSDYDLMPYHQQNPSSCNELFEKIEQGSIEEVKRLLDNGISVDIRNGYNTPLMVAVCYGHKSLVSLLIERHANIRAKNNGSTALMQAAGRGYTEIVSMLIQAAEAQVDIKELSLALIKAAQYGYLDTVLVLLEAGALLNVTDEEGKTAIERAARKGHKEIVRILMDRITEIPQSKEEDFLNYAALIGNCELVERLIEGGVNIKDQHNHALAYAALGGSVDALQKLLDYGANPNGFLNDGLPAVTHASAQGHVEVVKLLIAAGADINARGSVQEGYVLNAAVRGQHYDVVNELINAGVQLNVKQGDALIQAVKVGNKRIIQRLIQAEAKISLEPPARTRRSPEVVRSDIGRALEVLGNSTPEIIKMLLQAKACSALPQDLTGALEEAVSKKRESFVSFLINLGVPLSNRALEELLLYAGNDTLEKVIQLKSKSDSAMQHIFMKSLLFCRLEPLLILLKYIKIDLNKVPIDWFANIVANQRIDMLAYLISYGLDCSRFDNCRMIQISLHKYPFVCYLVNVFQSPEFKSYQTENSAIERCCIQGVYERSSCKQTVLMWASIMGDTHVVQKIIETCPRWFINAQDKYGYTALMYALLCKNFDIARELIKKSGNGLYLKDDNGDCALDHAVRSGSLEIFNALLETLVGLVTKGNPIKVPAKTLWLAQELGQWKMIANGLCMLIPLPDDSYITTALLT